MRACPGATRLLTTALFVAIVPVIASCRSGVDLSGYAAKFDDEYFSQRTLDYVYRQQASKGSAAKSKKDVLLDMVTDRLVARYLVKEKQFSAKGFSQDRALFVVFRAARDLLPKAQLDEAMASVTREEKLSPKDEESLVAMLKGQGPEGEVPEPIKQNATLLEYQFSQTYRGKISGDDLLRYLPIFDPTVPLAQGYLREILRYRYAAFLALERKHPDFVWLVEARQLEENVAMVRSYLRSIGYPGAGEFDEAKPPAFRQRRREIAPARVKEFFGRNKERFKFLTEIRARHLRTKDQDLAARAQEELKKGADFGALVKTYSIAADKDAPDPGRIPPVRFEPGRQASELEMVVARAPEHGAGETTLTTDGYEIAFVDERIYGYPSADDADVFFVASRELALEDLKKEYLELKERLLAKAMLEISPALK